MSDKPKPTLHQSFCELREAWLEFVLIVAEESGIGRVADWLTRKIKQWHSWFDSRIDKGG